MISISFIKNIILKNTMPSVYSIVQTNTIEHIYPICYLSEKHRMDMHNMFKCNKKINNLRSNFKYIDSIDDDNKWKELHNKNFLNTKYKKFVPNNNSKGIISRAILYMYLEYNYDFNKIISKKDLMNWFHKYPPSMEEIRHNTEIFKYQNTDNIFISKYDKIKFHINIE